ncbi:MAG: hypothetical protein OEN23_14690 [Paracoccaceae bacterium]|nr:hypothetical protein [Paracoccaceae bacterium]
MKHALLLLAVALLAGCAPGLEPAGTDTIAPGYAVGGGEWDSGGGITAVARIFERDGQTIVCGAWMTDRQSALSTLYNEDIIAAGSIFAGRVPIAHNLWFMRRLPYSENLSGQPANCAYAGLRWTAALSTAPVRIRFPRLSFGGRTIGGFGVGSVSVGPGTGDRVTFKEGPRPHPFR